MIRRLVGIGVFLGCFPFLCMADSREMWSRIAPVLFDREKQEVVDEILKTANAQDLIDIARQAAVASAESPSTAPAVLPDRNAQNRIDGSGFLAVARVLSGYPSKAGADARVLIQIIADREEPFTLP